jgi:type IV pilus assembly protein PilY1
VVNNGTDVTYQPNLDFNGIDTFDYTVSDGNGGTDTATVTVNVTAVNDDPVANDDPASMAEDGLPTTVSVLGNDTDAEGDSLSVTGVTQPTNGSVTFTAADVTYTPNADFNGADPFTYTVSDGNGGTDTATVTMNVTAVNDDPVANDDPASMAEDDVPTTIAVLGNDTDVDGDALSVTGVTQPTNGSVAFTAADVTYTPNADFNGADPFTYTIGDGNGSSDTATVNMTVTSVNDDPVAIDDVATTDEDTMVSVTVLTNDSDPVEGDAISISSVATPPANGSTFINGANIEYTPNLNFNGADSFVYEIDDGNGGTATATVNITVNSINDAPTTSGLADFTVNEDSPPVNVDLSTIFGDVDIATNGDSLSYSVVFSGPPVDTATIPVASSILTLSFLPEQNGVTTVTVTATDTQGPVGVSTSFDVTVAPVNDAPFVVPPAIADQTIDEDSGVLNVSFAGVFDDVDIATNGDALSYMVVVSGDLVFSSALLSGTSVALTTAADRNGVATVTITATDSGAPGLSVSTSFDVTVNPINDAPTVVAPIADRTVPEDGPDIAITLYPFGVFDDVDIATNGDTLTFAVSTSNPGLFDLESTAGGVLTLSLAQDQNGGSTVTVTATDAAGLSVSDTFVLTVPAVDDLPVAGDSTETMNEDDPGITINVMANVSSPDGPASLVSAGTTLVIGGVSYPNSSESTPTIVLDPFGDPIELPNGRVTLSGGAVLYEPKEHFFGTDFFTYTVSDPEGDQASGTITITVIAVNDPPIGIQEQTYTMGEASVLSVPAVEGVFFGAYDVDGKLLDAMGNELGSALSAIPQTSPLNGSLVFDNATGAFVYTPNITFVGDDSFSYRLFDGFDLSSDPVYSVRITVIPVPPPPPPPPPGTVTATYNLSQTPLEQLATVPANVLVVMDDSGSMDWQLIIPSTNDGGFLLDNSAIATKGLQQENYVYLYDLKTNTYPATSQYGRVVPTEEALALDAVTVGNEYGVWRARNHQYNALYYNPQISYMPWTGQDVLNQPFVNANPTAVRLDPIDPGTTQDITALVSYKSTSVPRWDANGSSTNVDVDNLYIPFYYTTLATPPLLATDTFDERIEIKVGSGTLPGDMFPGGRNRVDCEIVDGDPLDCSYAEEIQNFANWYQYARSREYVTKGGIGTVVAAVQNLRVGYDTISATTSEEIRPMNERFTEGNKKILLDNIYSVNSSGGTPLRQALARAGKTFECSAGGGTCPILPAPDGYCQQNFALLFTDGFWNGGAGSPGNIDDNGTGPFDGGRYADTISATLADTAMDYYERDLWPTYDDLVPVGNRDFIGAPAGTFSGVISVMHQHMKTFAIGFGLNGTFDPATLPVDPTVPFGWTDPFSGSLQKIDDMVHAATNGRGSFVNASNPQQLRAAFEAAFLEFTQAASSVSAAAFNSTSLQEDTLLFRGFFDLRDNTGELIAVEVFSDGSLAATPRWSASNQLDALVMPGGDPTGSGHVNRKIVTFDPVGWQGIQFRNGFLTPDQMLNVTPAEVDWLRGWRDDELPTGTLRERNALRGLLGDIINSSPVFVGTPRDFNRDQAPYPTTDLYSDFVTAHTNRTPIVYVGANDGMMHGFSADTGNELIAYVPNKILDSSVRYANNLQNFTSPAYFHQYYVDLTPRLNDVFMRSSAGAVGKSWNSVMIGGLGVGGKGYFALNVTDPDTMFATEVAATNAVLWEFTDEDDTYPVDSFGIPLGGAVGAITDPLGKPIKDLGYAQTTPTIAMTNVDDGSGERKWAAITGNGFNSTSGIAKLFVLFMDAGLDGWQAGDFLKLDTGVGVPVPPAQKAGLPNGAGAPALVDKDLNGTVDLAYFGDLLGNLYRADLSDSNPANWTVTRLFTATYDDGAVDVRQPITTQPLVVKHPYEIGFIVTFGTGSFVTREDASTTEIQSIYGIWDRGEGVPATAASDTKALRLVEQVVTNVVQEVGGIAITRRTITENSVNYQAEGGGPGTYGWYFDFDMPRATTTLAGNPNPDDTGQAPPLPQYPGERAIRKFILRDGVIITPTVLPASEGSSCFGARPGAIMLFDAVTGGNPQFPVVDFNNNDVVDSGDLVDVAGVDYAAGLLFNQDDLEGTLVDLSTLGGEGDTDFLFVSGGSETTAFRIVDISDDRTGRLAWRELDDAN